MSTTFKSLLDSISNKKYKANVQMSIPEILNKARAYNKEQVERGNYTNLISIPANPYNTSPKKLFNMINVLSGVELKKRTEQIIGEQKVGQVTYQIIASPTGNKKSIEDNTKSIYGGIGNVNEAMNKKTETINDEKPFTTDLKSLYK